MYPKYYDSFYENTNKKNNDKDNTNVKISKICYMTIFFRCMVGIAVCMSFYTIINRNANTSIKTNGYETIFSDFAENNDVEMDSYSIAISVESPDYGVLSTIDDLPWDGVVEPHRQQILSISQFSLQNQFTDISDYIVSWDLAGSNYKGDSVTIMMNTTGIYDCRVSIYKKDGFVRKRRLSHDINSQIYTYDFTLAVKYVRREIRSMTDSDREKYFTAIDLMYSLDEETGQSRYGSKFHSAEYFSYKHLTGAGTTDCDHWHDGAAIITHHMAFTLEFEQTLRAVDPSIANPYWEYGMDTYLYDSWSDSPVFDADWFGESSPTNPEHKINDGGRWVGIAVPDGSPYYDWNIEDTGSLNPYVNAYGHMRSPWNNNPFQEIGRHNMTYDMTQYQSMPTCSTLQSCFKGSSLADINECSNGATHGPVHILIGGAWGEGNLFQDEDIVMAQKPDKLLFFKVLWRMGFTRCPDTCELGEVCRCSVPQEYIDEYGAEYILKATNVYYGLETYLEDADDELLLKVLRAVEDSGIAGEMFSSAAAFDPIFWPLHGQIERLLGAKRILISQGEITDFDETWAFTEYNKYGGGAYLNGVCDWSQVQGVDDLTLPTCTMDVICSGHNEDDVLEFGGFISDDDQYTNGEFYDFIHPWSDDLPYTYDTWDFDYCADVGYSFTGESSLPIPNSPDSGSLDPGNLDPSLLPPMTGPK